MLTAILKSCYSMLNVTQRLKFRRNSTLKISTEKTGYLRRAREKFAAFNKEIHSRNLSSENEPNIKLHLVNFQTIQQPVGDFSFHND